MVACRAILREGSKSFAAASLALPARLRAPAAAIYAFCRVADDAVDLGDDVALAVRQLHARLDAIYAGTPADDPVDRAFSEVVLSYSIPKTIPLALLDGFAWDAEGKRYETLEDLEGYCARVASTVGVMMTLLMGPREPHVLARACDLGLAMQLTNICRDVGEDARNGRIYLPLSWLRAAGIDKDELTAAPRFSKALGDIVERLLGVAEKYYARSDIGITMLPRDSRLAIRGARLIYSDIGREIAKNNYDSISQRAFTSALRKVWLLLRSFGSLFWRSRDCDIPAEKSVAFLTDVPQQP